MEDEPIWTDEALVMALNSADGELSLKAAEHLRRLPPLRIGSLVRSGYGLRLSPFRHGTRFVGILLVAIVILAATIRSFSPAVTLAGVVVGIAFLLYACIAISYAPRQDMSRCFDRLAMHISALSTAGALPTIVSLLATDHAIGLPPVIRRAVLASARNVLATLTDRQFDDIAPDARCTLERLLSTPYEDPELTVIIIETLARRSDPFELGFRALLSGLASQSAPTPSMKSVRAAAYQALDRLAARRDEQSLAQSLVRASNCPDPAPELLRPAAELVRSSGELVRAATVDGHTAEHPVER